MSWVVEKHHNLKHLCGWSVMVVFPDVKIEKRKNIMYHAQLSICYIEGGRLEEFDGSLVAAALLLEVYVFCVFSFFASAGE